MSEEHDDLDRRTLDKQRFRFDTGINIAHILTTAGMMFVVLNWGSNVNASLAVQQNEVANIKLSSAVARVETSQALQEINRKLDKIMDERRNGK